jgi:hypothetical protein
VTIGDSIAGDAAAMEIAVDIPYFYYLEERKSAMIRRIAMVSILL